MANRLTPLFTQYERAVKEARRLWPQDQLVILRIGTSVIAGPVGHVFMQSQHGWTVQILGIEPSGEKVNESKSFDID